MKTPFQSLFALGMLGLLWTTGGLESHEASIPSLFRSVVLPEPTQATETGLPILRTARIVIDHNLFDPTHPSAIYPGSRWVVNLFNDRTVVFHADHATTPRMASRTVTGTIEGHPGSLVVLASVDNAVNGIITIPKLGRFQIEFTPDQKQRLTEIDPAASPSAEPDPNLTITRLFPSRKTNPARHPPFRPPHSFRSFGAQGDQTVLKQRSTPCSSTPRAPSRGLVVNLGFSV